MKKVTDVFAEKPWTFSFEFFPPKSDKGRDTMFETARNLAAMKADFFSVTYGAGGTDSKTTLDAVLGLLYRYDVAVMHHLTCVKHTYREIREQLAGMRRVGVRNIMALRGDPPQDEPNFKLGEDQPRYAYQLIELIREHGDWFAVGVPGFPEGHPMTPSIELDSQYLKVKQDRGANFAITQLFHDNAVYYEFVRRVRAAGVTIRLIPGILPITDYRKLVQFCKNCGATVSPQVKEIFEPLQDDPDATYKAGVEFVTKQCQDLLDHGAPGIHFYCLNRSEPIVSIWKALKL